MEKRKYTIEDIYALPEHERAELIKGEMYKMPMSGTIHQRIVGFLGCTILDYFKETGIKDEVFMSRMAVFLSEGQGQDTYVEPDITVICDPKRLDEKGCHGAPDWIVEVVMPSSRRMDYLNKPTLYIESGVREYWIVDPDRKEITTYEKKDERFLIKYKFGEPVQVGLYEGLEITIDPEICEI